MFSKIITNLKKQWYYFKYFLELRKFDKEVEQNVNMSFGRNSSVDVDKDTKLYEGIYNLKTQVKAAAIKNNQTNEEFLTNNPEVIDYGRSETAKQRQDRELLTSVLIPEGKDIKSDKDFNAMVQTRIAMYHALHEDKIKRQMMRDIREASRTDEQQYQKLLKEFNDKYRSSNRA